jgi:hypothetical protein
MDKSDKINDSFHKGGGKRAGRGGCKLSAERWRETEADEGIAAARSR